MINEKEIKHAVDGYLKRLGWSLGELPQHERDEIIKEIRSHLLDRFQASETEEEFQRILDEFGPPEIYARSFLEGYEVAVALASGSPWQMLKQNFRMMDHGFKLALTFVGLALLYGASIAFFIGGFLKFFFPENIGFWVSINPFYFYYGINLTPDSATEALGFLFIPFSLLCSFILMKVSLSLSRRSLISFAEKRSEKKK